MTPPALGSRIYSVRLKMAFPSGAPSHLQSFCFVYYSSLALSFSTYWILSLQCFTCVSCPQAICILWPTLDTTLPVSLWEDLRLVPHLSLAEKLDFSPLYHEEFFPGLPVSPSLVINLWRVPGVGSANYSLSAVLFTWELLCAEGYSRDFPIHTLIHDTFAHTHSCTFSHTYNYTHTCTHAHMHTF